MFIIILRFSIAAKLVSERYRDQPMTPLELAIYWVEYVIRHEGAPQLQSPAKRLSLWVYYSLDVFAFTAAISVLVVWIFWQILKGVFGSAKNIQADKARSKTTKSKIN